jgi:hypothetical protein
MKQFIKDTWDEIHRGKYLDSYLAIFACFAIFILDLFYDPDQSTISQVLLVTLGILAYSTIITRRTHEDIKNSLSQLSRPTTSIRETLQQRYVHSDVAKNMRDCLVVWFWGITFTRTIPILKDNIEKGLESGVEIRVLMIKPRSDAVRMNALRKRHGDEERINTQLTQNLSALADLYRRCRSSPGKLEVRCIDFLPPWTIIVLDPFRSTGRFYLRFSSFCIPNEDRLTLDVTQQGEKELFEHFVRQFQSIWNNSEIVDLEHFHPQNITYHKPV